VPTGWKVMRLTPALGQQKIYVLVFTTENDLRRPPN
jgi:maltose operon protein